MSEDGLPKTGFLRLNSILAPHGPIPVSKSTWWDGVRNGRYPPPIKLGPRITAWPVGDIRALIKRASQPAPEISQPHRAPSHGNAPSRSPRRRSAACRDGIELVEKKATSPNELTSCSRPEPRIAERDAIKAVDEEADRCAGETSTKGLRGRCSAKADFPGHRPPPSSLALGTVKRRRS